jgi:hypothetical protein
VIKLVVIPLLAALGACDPSPPPPNLTPDAKPGTPPADARTNTSLNCQPYTYTVTAPAPTKTKTVYTYSYALVPSIHRSDRVTVTSCQPNTAICPAGYTCSDPVPAGNEWCRVTHDGSFLDDVFFVDCGGSKTDTYDASGALVSSSTTSSPFTFIGVSTP